MNKNIILFNIAAFLFTACDLANATQKILPLEQMSTNYLKVFAVLPETIDIRQLAFSPDGKFLAAGGFGNQIHVWDLQSKKIVKSFSIGELYKTNSSNTPSCLAWSPDGNSLVVCMALPPDGAYVFNSKNWELIKKLNINSESNSLSFSTDGKLIALLGYSSNSISAANINIFKTSDWTKIKEANLASNNFTEGWNFYVRNILFKPNSRVLAINFYGKFGGIEGEYGTRLLLWDIDTKAPNLLNKEEFYKTIPISSGDEGIAEFAFNEDGSQFSVSNYKSRRNGKVRPIQTWDFSTFKSKTLVDEYSDDGDDWGLTYANKGKYLIAGKWSENGTIAVINTSTYKILDRFNTDTRINVLRASQINSMVAAGTDENIIIWRVVDEE